MSGSEDTTRRLRISKLEAKLELQEIERAALMRTIKSPLTVPDDQEEALRQHEDSMDFNARLRNKLNALCRPQSNLVH